MFELWPRSSTVRTSAFQAGSRGSIPLGATLYGVEVKVFRNVVAVIALLSFLFGARLMCERKPTSGFWKCVYSSLPAMVVR
jgi:hypothetical protein